MLTELKNIVNCPSCKVGAINHKKGMFICNNDDCNYYLPGQFFGVKLSKTKIISLVKKGFVEPMEKRIVIKDKEPFPAFLTLNKELKIQFKLDKDFPVTRCPKCKKDHVIMRYSSNKNSFYYSCKNSECDFYLPYIYREKPFSIDNIKKLCALKKISKTYLDKVRREYTVWVFLGKEDYKIKTKF